MLWPGKVSDPLLKRSWSRWLPEKLKYRFFLAFVLLILIPYAIIQFYQFLKIEKIVEQNISRSNQMSLEQMASDFNNLKSNAMMVLLMLEKDKKTTSMLLQPDNHSNVERESAVLERFKTMQDFMPANSFMYIVWLDNFDGVYSSFSTGLMNSYHDFALEEGFTTIEQTDEPYRWLVHDNKITGQSSTLLSLYSVTKDPSGETVWKLRISIDYHKWFHANAREFSLGQNYFIVNHSGEMIAASRTGSKLPADIVHYVSSTKDYHIDKSTTAVINVLPIPDMDWYLVSQFPLERYFGDLQVIRNNVIITSLILTVFFVLITFLISTSMTRPLKLLQQKMKEMVRSNLKLQLPPHKYRGEILVLYNAFNNMIDDINDLIQKLRTEEKQKESVHFQMLLNQVNPHFLFNTLNTMKWIALDKQIGSIYEICLSLGRLLETSLNSDIDLIHLKDELELVQAYVFIQKHRYGDMFDVDYRVVEGIEYALVPKLSLQPLVENAIRHGFARIEHGGKIIISIYAEEGKMIMEVEDNGSGFDESVLSTSARKGIGISNIQQRLRLLYKDEAQFEIISTAQGSCIRMTMPLLISEPYVKGNDSNVDDSNRRG